MYLKKGKGQQNGASLQERKTRYKILNELPSVPERIAAVEKAARNQILCWFCIHWLLKQVLAANCSFSLSQYFTEIWSLAGLVN